MWKHVVDRFRAAGATNVKWVWAPGHKAYEKAYEKDISRMFYAGNAYMDWSAVDDDNKSARPQSSRPIRNPSGSQQHDSS